MTVVKLQVQLRTLGRVSAESSRIGRIARC